ncbi:MAG: hypothetical protein QOH13_2489 [Thermoleophilaceae bacterium]|nr:hypothetical protein [Thermoleophilaceae bacterium]
MPSGLHGVSGETSLIPRRWFAASSFWNKPLTADAPLDRRSGDWVAHIVGKVAAAGHSWINTNSYSVPIYTVPADQPRVQVKIDWATAGYDEQFKSVPVPPGLIPAAGDDARVAIWQPATDTLWEFLQMHRDSRDNGAWHTTTAGRIEHVSSDDGLFEEHPPADWYGAAATSLPTVPGLITPEELRRGRIEHVVSLAIPHPLHKWWWSRPAQRSDGDSIDPADVPEGARFRLPPGLDIAKLRLPRAAAIIARAVQKYGLVVSDKSTVVHFYAQDPVNLGADPYPVLFGGLRPDEVLKAFPWGSLQALRSEPNTPWPALAKVARAPRRRTNGR